VGRGETARRQSLERAAITLEGMNRKGAKNAKTSLKLLAPSHIAPSQPRRHEDIAHREWDTDFTDFTDQHKFRPSVRNRQVRESTCPNHRHQREYCPLNKMRWSLRSLRLCGSNLRCVFVVATVRWNLRLSARSAVTPCDGAMTQSVSICVICGLRRCRLPLLSTSHATAP